MDSVGRMSQAGSCRHRQDVYGDIQAAQLLSEPNGKMVPEVGLFVGRKEGKEELAQPVTVESIWGLPRNPKGEHDTPEALLS